MTTRESLITELIGSTLERSDDPILLDLARRLKRLPADQKRCQDCQEPLDNQEDDLCPSCWTARGYDDNSIS